MPQWVLKFAKNPLPTALVRVGSGTMAKTRAAPDRRIAENPVTRRKRRQRHGPDTIGPIVNDREAQGRTISPTRSNQHAASVER